MPERAPTLQNRKAHFDYFLMEGFEAGMVLEGCEVKSIRNGKASLQDSFARIERGEAVLYGMHITPYEQGNRYNPDPMRVRKLLLNRSEIERLSHRVMEKGLTLVPVRLYFKGGRAKLWLCVAKGKHQGDKREKLKEREARREMDRALKTRRRNG
jgi:SsrA-binding protein